MTALSLVIAGCSPKPASQGRYGAVIIICDDDERERLRAAVDSPAGKVLLTPQDEPLFRIEFLSPSDLARAARSPLVAVVGDPDGNSPAGNLARSALSPDALKAARNGRIRLFRRDDVWAVPQRHYLFLRPAASNDREEAALWSSLAAEWRDFEIDRIHRLWLRRGAASVERFASDGVELQLLLPREFQRDSSRGSSTLLRFRASNPERWLTLAPVADSAPMTAESWVKIRDGRLVGSGQITRSSDRMFPPRPGKSAIQPTDLNFYGLWEPDGAGQGGSYISLVLASPGSATRLIFDGSVRAPGKAKAPYLWEMAAIGRSITFSTVQEN